MKDKKNILVKDQKKLKKSFLTKIVTHLQIFFDQNRIILFPPQKFKLSNYKTFQENLKFKIKSKFTTGQLKSLKLPLQTSTQRSIFAYPLMQRVLKWLETQ